MENSSEKHWDAQTDRQSMIASVNDCRFIYETLVTATLVLELGHLLWSIPQTEGRGLILNSREGLHSFLETKMIFPSMTALLLSKRLSHNICPTQTIINNFRWHYNLIKNSLILALVWSNLTCYAIALRERLQISGCVQLSAARLVPFLLPGPHWSLFKMCSSLEPSQDIFSSNTHRVMADLRKNKDFSCSDIVAVMEDQKNIFTWTLIN